MKLIKLKDYPLQKAVDLLNGMLSTAAPKHSHHRHFEFWANGFACNAAQCPKIS
jgi:hypothetical protein